MSDIQDVNNNLIRIASDTATNGARLERVEGQVACLCNDLQDMLPKVVTKEYFEDKLKVRIGEEVTAHVKKCNETNNVVNVEALKKTMKKATFIIAAIAGGCAGLFEIISKWL